MTQPRRQSRKVVQITYYYFFNIRITYRTTRRRLFQGAENVVSSVRAVMHSNLHGQNDRERQDSKQVNEHHHRLEYVILQPASKRTVTSKKRKSFLHNTWPAHRAALISVSIALSQTPAYAARPPIRGQCIAWCCACLRHAFAGTQLYQVILLGNRKTASRQ